MSAADAMRVQEARRRLESFPPDADLVKMTPAELVTWAVRMQGAAQLLDAYVREAEADDARRLAEVRDLLARFDWELDDRQYALEAIDRIVGSDDEDQADEPEHDHWRDNYACTTCGALIGVFIGHGDGWHHYRGEGTAASPVELFDADHEATFGAGQEAGQ